MASDLARRTQDFLIDMKVAYHRFRHTEDAAADWKVQEQLEALGYVDGGDGTVP